MIQANELRIGNYIRCKIYNGNTDVIIPFAWQELKYLHLFEPIPLESEILEKCGFEDEGNHWTHPKNESIDLIFSVSKNGLWCAYNMALVRPDPTRVQHVEYNAICNPFQYLHQLQNLYFALTGEELTYKS